ncbi:S-layer homology domain-containing protein [Paenibacillus sp. MMO-177]|uniref:S-layer homology domain-containing protein n=1 Tax=Paenibacillus sp. MMO-177 TaxID=3081289 RepID=UPI0030160B9E
MTLQRKMFNPLLTALLAVTLLLGGLSFDSARAQASAGVPVQLTIGDVSVNTGGTVDVPVSIKQPERGIGSYNVQLNFDPKALEIISVKPKYGDTNTETCSASQEGCFVSNTDQDNGWLRVIWVDTTGGDRLINEAKQLFTVQVKAKSGSESAKQKLTVDKEDPASLTFTDGDMHSLPVAVTEGEVTVYPNLPIDTGKVKVIVDGKEQGESATLSSVVVNGRVVTTISVDNEKVAQQLKQNQIKTLTLPVEGSREVVVGELNGQLVKLMENRDAALVIQTNQASYTLSASQMNIDLVASQLGAGTALQDIKIHVTISAVKDKQGVEQAAANSGADLIATPVQFEVTASYGGKSVTIDRFSNYVNRTIEIPDGVDPSHITTGVVMASDGTVTHVPTLITQSGGHYYAQINSLTNSTYAVVWHSKTFADVTNHWAKADINDLASRMVIQGVSADTFAPDRSVTRAEFTAILLRALGIHASKDDTQVSFRDVGATAWYHDSVVDAVSYGLITGYSDGSFHPNASISRQEAIVMINRASAMTGLVQASASETAGLISPFSDKKNIDSWALEAVASVAKQGIVKGTNGKLLPKQPVTRAESAVMMKRVLVAAGLINS